MEAGYENWRLYLKQEEEPIALLGKAYKMVYLHCELDASCTEALGIEGEWQFDWYCNMPATAETILKIYLAENVISAKHGIISLTIKSFVTIIT